MSGYTDSIVSEVRRDFARKERLVRGVGPYVTAAMDGIDEMTTGEFAAQCLKRLGLDSCNDPAMALEAWLLGRQHAAEARAGLRPAFAQDGAPSFMDKYLAKNEVTK